MCMYMYMYSIHILSCAIELATLKVILNLQFSQIYIFTYDISNIILHFIQSNPIFADFSKIYNIIYCNKHFAD